MKSKLSRMLVLLVVVAMLLVAALPAVAAPAAPPTDEQLTATAQGATTTLEVNKTAERWPYIIRLQGEPLALYTGGVQGLSATNPKALGEAKLNMTSEAAKAYMDYLAAQQADFVAELQQVASSAEVVHSYRVTLNGVAAIMTAEEAARAAQLPGVVSVVADELLQRQTDVGPQFIGAVNVWDGSAAGAGEGTKGEGVIVGVIDDGIWPEHPSFIDGTFYNLEVRLAGTDTVVLPLSGVGLEQGVVYTAYAVGSVAGTGDQALGAILSVDNAAAPTAGKARVRVVHASPDAPAVDVLVNDGAAFEDLPYKGITDYAELDPGTYNIKVVPAGATEPVVIEADLALAADTDYTVMAVGALADIEALVLVDDNSDPAELKAHLRFVHASPDAPAVDVALAGGAVLFGDVEFKESSSYLPVDSGYPEPPASWSGECVQPADDSPGYECSNKLIGINFHLDTYDQVIGYDGLFFSGRDDNGHGTHTSSTAAGNKDVPVTLLGIDRGLISGIAPRAHVASYKGLGPQGGFTSDLVAAIEQATADGVDVINYSIGGGASNPWGDADALAFLAAREAGIFVATSAGNSGPGPDTVGSPGNAPWIATVGASTSNRHFISDITLSGPGEPPTGLYGASVTAGVTNFNLVDAEGIPDSEGDDSGLCLNAFDPGTFQTNDVVLCQRGVIDRVLRGAYVAAGGGGGVILYNPVQQGLSTDSYVIPAVHVENDIGQQIKDYITQYPGQVAVSFTQGTATYAESDPRVIADMMASFSSRGPNGPVPAVIKPDVTAPGVQTLAGNSPENYETGAQGQLFQAIQGTSMSSPHTAGAGALLAALHPDWSPAAIQSALMTTGINAVVKEDGSTPADPFDLGGGRIDLNRAADPGLVFDMTADDYEAGEDDPANMNLPSLGFGNIAGRATIQRTATNLLDVEAMYQVSTEAPEGVTISVSPDPVVVPANGTATFEVTVDAVGAPEGWHFGSVTLSHGPHAVRMPVAFFQTAAVWSSLSFETQFDKDTVPFELTTGQDADPFVVNTYGLVDPIVIAGGPIPQDPDQDPTTDFCGEGQECYELTAAGGELWWVFQTSSTEINDIDLYLYYDSNGDGTIDPSTDLVDASTTPTANEEVEAVLPEAGLWLVQVQAWAGSGTYTLNIWDVTVEDRDGSVMMMDVPASIEAGNTYDMTFAWDHPIKEGVEYLGLVTLGDGDDPLALGFEPVRITGDLQAVRKTADRAEAEVGDTVNYELVLSNTSDMAREAELVDMIPSELMVDPESLTGGATYEDGKVMWSGTLDAAGNTVVIGDSDFPYGYVSLASLGVAPISGVCTSCDEAAVNFSGDLVSYLGVEYETICMVTNGYLVMGGCASTDDIQYIPQNFPDAAVPNNVVAPLWMDFDLDGGDGQGGGTWYAAGLTDGVDDWRVFEWEDAQRYGEDGTAFTFQVWLQEGEEAVTYTYARLDGPFGGTSVGAENADASAGTNYYYNDGSGNEEGTEPTTEDVLDVSGGFSPYFYTIGYSAEAVATGDATNTATVTSGMDSDSDSATVSLVLPAEPIRPRSRRFNATQDTYINGAQPGANFGGDQGMWVGYYDYMRPVVYTPFPVCDDVYTCIPSDSAIDTAYLYVYVYDGRGYYNWANSTMNVFAHAVNSGWSEDTATWVTPWTSPGGDFGPPVDAAQIGSGRIGTWVRFDVTDIVASIVNDGAANNGFALSSTWATEVPGMASPDGIAPARFGLATNQYWDPSKVPYLRIMYRTFTGE